MTCGAGDGRLGVICVHGSCVFYVGGYESLLRQVLQCGRPPGFVQASAPLVVPRPTHRRPRTPPVAPPPAGASPPLAGTPAGRRRRGASSRSSATTASSAQAACSVMSSPTKPGGGRDPPRAAPRGPGLRGRAPARIAVGGVPPPGRRGQSRSRRSARRIGRCHLGRARRRGAWLALVVVKCPGLEDMFVRSCTPGASSTSN